MSKFNKKLVLITVMTAILLSFGTLSNVHAEDLEVKEESSLHFGKGGYNHKSIRPHFNYYYQLLAEKYAPKHVKVWNEVTKDREALYKKYKELKKEGKELDKFYDEEWLNKHKDIQKQFLEAVEKRDEEALKEIVPLVIDHHKELNSLLKKRLKEIK